MFDVKKDLELVIGHPFEHEWEIDYDIFSEDKIDPTILFYIKDKKENNILALSFNYGISIVKFNSENYSKIIVSIFETDMIDEGEYYYEYNPKTFSGKEIANISGKIIATTSKSDQVPKIQRQVRPWDLLKSKEPGSMGERVSEEEQQKRISICRECPRFVKLTSQCLECGCIMNLKTKLAAATCPLGKW